MLTRPSFTRATRSTVRGQLGEGGRQRLPGRPQLGLAQRPPARRRRRRRRRARSPRRGRRRPTGARLAARLGVPLHAPHRRREPRRLDLAVRGLRETDRRPRASPVTMSLFHCTAERVGARRPRRRGSSRLLGPAHVEHPDLLAARVGLDHAAERDGDSWWPRQMPQAGHLRRPRQPDQLLDVGEPRGSASSSAPISPPSTTSPAWSSRSLRQRVARVGASYVERGAGLGQPVPDPPGRAAGLVLDDEDGAGITRPNLSGARGSDEDRHQQGRTEQQWTHTPR